MLRTRGRVQIGSDGVIDGSIQAVARWSLDPSSNMSVRHVAVEVAVETHAWSLLIRAASHRLIAKHRRGVGRQVTELCLAENGAVRQEYSTAGARRTGLFW